MAGTSLLALLDDIATVLDDISLLTKVAAKKTAGVLGDDLALNAEQVSGVRADRELPVVWAVAKGSFKNKLILVPAALAISAGGNAFTPVSEVLDERAFVNGIVGLNATGGSTNLVIHLIAMARAAGVLIDRQDMAEISAVTPLIARVYPNGLADVNHFHAAGGLGYMIGELLGAGLLHEDVRTVAGPGLSRYTQEPRLDGERVVWTDGPAQSGNDKILRTVADPFQPTGGLQRLTGNDDLLDVRGPFVDAQCAHASVQEFYGVVGQDSDPPHDLDGCVDDPLCRLGCEGLGHGGFPSDAGGAQVLLVRRPIDQHPRGGETVRVVHRPGLAGERAVAASPLSVDLFKLHPLDQNRRVTIRSPRRIIIEKMRQIRGHDDQGFRPAP